MRRFSIFIAALAAGWSALGAPAAEKRAAAPARQGRVAVCIPLHGRLDEFLVEAFHNRVREAERLIASTGDAKARTASLVIFDIHTTTGSPDVAIGLADAVHALRKRGIATAALVREPGSPSATLLALACEKIFIAPKARLAPIDPGAFGPPESKEQAKQLLDAAGRYSADRPRLRPLYQAFVDPAPEVYAVVFEGREGQPAFYAAAEFKRVMAASPERVVRSERVAKKGERASLAAADAKRLGVAADVAGSVGETATRLKVAGRDLKLLKAAGKPEAVAAKPGTKGTPEKKAPRIKPVGTGRTVVFITLDGMVGDGMLHSIQRRLKEAEELDPALVVFELDTFGGKLLSALEIGNLIFDLPKPRTVAYVNDKAISAGSLISVACDEIVMQKGSELGDCGVVDTSGKQVKSEKIDTLVRARFRSFCEGKYPGALAMSMVTEDMEVIQVKTRDGETEYLTGKEFDNLTPEERERYVSSKKIVHSDELLTMTDGEAKEYGFSRATVKSRTDVIELYGLGDRTITVLDWNWSETFVRTLDAIGPVLLTLGILGIIIELKTPGFGVFGLAGLALIAVFFFGKYTAGLAEVWEILLFVVGVGLLAAEIFVTPGFGVLGVLGILAMVSSLLLSLQSFTVPASPIQWKLFEGNLGTLGGVIVGVFAGIVLAARYLHRAPYVGRLVLPAAPSSMMPTSVTESVSPAPAAEKAAARADALTGWRGRAVSMLRPAGRAEFDGEPLDVVTEGDFIRPGEPIEICQVRGNRIVVRRVG